MYLIFEVVGLIYLHEAAKWNPPRMLFSCPFKSGQPGGQNLNKFIHDQPGLFLEEGIIPVGFSSLWVNKVRYSPEDQAGQVVLFRHPGNRTRVPVPGRRIELFDQEGISQDGYPCRLRPTSCGSLAGVGDQDPRTDPDCRCSVRWHYRSVICSRYRR